MSRYAAPLRTAVDTGSLARPLVGLFALGAIAVGVSGGVAEVMGRVWGAGFVSGDQPGTTYPAERCAEYEEYFPGHGCLDAASLHHWGEVVQYRVVFGVLGLVALVVYTRMQRRAPVSPAWVVPAAAAAMFGLAALVLGAVATRSAVAGGQGVGASLSAAVVSATVALGTLAVLVCVVLASRRSPTS